MIHYSEVCILHTNMCSTLNFTSVMSTKFIHPKLQYSILHIQLKVASSHYSCAQKYFLGKHALHTP